MTDPIPSTSEIESLLPLWVGGDLESEQMELVEAALARDPALRAQAQRAQEAREVFRAELRAHADDDALPAGVASVWPGLRAQLLAEGLIPGAVSAEGEPGTLTPIHSLSAGRASSPRPASAPRRIASRLAMGAGLAAAAALLLLLRPWQEADQPGTSGREVGGAIAFQPAPQAPIDVLPASDGAGAQLVLDQEGLLRPAGLLEDRIAEQVWSSLGRQGFGVPAQDPLSDGQQHQAVSGFTGPFLLTPTTLPGLR